MTLAEKMSEGLIVLIIGMLVVFAVLILLWGLLEAMRVIFYDMPNRKKASETPQNPDNQKPDTAVSNIPAPVIPQEEADDELIAVIAAAVAASMDTPVHNLRIKSIRKVSNWNK